MLAWMKKSFDESKHPRGKPENAGEFSSGGKGGGGKGKSGGSAKRKPTPDQSRNRGKPQFQRNPGTVGASLPEKKQPPPLPVKQAPPPLPAHHQTMKSAIDAGNAALQEMKSGQPGPAKEAFRKALHAHYEEGVTVLANMAREKYGSTPRRAYEAFIQGREAFRAKIRAAWGRVHQKEQGPVVVGSKNPPPVPYARQRAGKALSASVVTKAFEPFDLLVELPADTLAWMRADK